MPVHHSDAVNARCRPESKAEVRIVSPFYKVVKVETDKQERDGQNDAEGDPGGDVLTVFSAHVFRWHGRLQSLATACKGYCPFGIIESESATCSIRIVYKSCWFVDYGKETRRAKWMALWSPSVKAIFREFRP